MMVQEKVGCQCIKCHGRAYSLWCDSGGLSLHGRRGELIQNAMPYLSPDEREILISGICGRCFDEMYGEDDDDEYGDDDLTL